MEAMFSSNLKMVEMAGFVSCVVGGRKEEGRCAKKEVGLMV